MRDVMEAIQPELAVSARRADLGLWVRRFFMSCFAAVIVLALCNVFGQRASSVATETNVARLTVHAPTTVRPGLLFQARVTLTAHQPIHAAQLVLSHGWIDGLTLNTAEPSPVSETSGPGGALVLSLGSLEAGQTFTQYLDFQVNPTSVSGRTQTVTVRSDGVEIATLSRTMTLVP